jgi:hypothetical protein
MVVVACLKMASIGKIFAIPEPRALILAGRTPEK